jgi:hypothetical protein
MEKDRTTRRIEREAEHADQNDKDARDGMKDAIKSAMKDGDTHRNISSQLLRARRGDSNVEHRERFGDDNEVITGNPEDSPWLRD